MAIDFTQNPSTIPDENIAALQQQTQRSNTQQLQPSSQPHSARYRKQHREPQNRLFDNGGFNHPVLQDTPIPHAMMNIRQPDFSHPQKQRKGSRSSIWNFAFNGGR